MNLNDLDIFCAIIDEGSLNKAAKALGYAQSNVSARLKTLEHEFQTTLLVRQTRGVTPTAVGRRLYDASVRINAELGEVRRVAAGTPGDLLVTETLLHHLMTNDPTFSPGRFDTVAVRRQSEIIPEARRHQYAAVISFMDLSTLTNYRKAGTLTLKAAYLVGLDDESATSETTAGANRTGENNVGENETLPILINSDRECAFRKQTLQDLRTSAGIDSKDAPRKTMEVDSLETIITMVEQRKGIALLPTYLTHQRKLRAMDSTEIDLRYTIYEDVSLLS
ncbi:LysR family transcriptional regulator [Bifidobacterium sp. ESL0790]|uniref:LysR family transcriptional regulator n=1 Tax=Bifidobacterium sp. ESL0790 TaxID=2983233 RepID=UPI0023F7EEA6|nr:LysR family transcriptional regulator [Bifidobacterium sp. ESL0790]WEV71723.1 LysR family transcriptional regulator [Bifidobacterium sp. ESL0790]